VTAQVTPPPGPVPAPPQVTPPPRHSITSESGSPEPVELSPSRDVDHNRAEYERLTALEGTAPETALAGYLALARTTGRDSGQWPEVALFAAARLAADLHDRRAVDRHERRAETLLRIYLRRFPSSANAKDARKLLERLKEISP
jgi:hypothetical protein